MDPVVMVALEVGTTKEKLVGKYSDGKLSVELEKPAKFGKLSDLLKEYDVSVESWPTFLQDVLTLDAWLWAIEYGTKAVGTSTGTKLAESSFTVASGFTFPSDLEGAELSPDSTDSDTYTVKKGGSTLKYTATKSNGTYTINANVYKFVIQGKYEKSLTLVKGLLALKSIAFGITNDPSVTADAFEKACRKVLDAAHGPDALPAHD